MNQRQALKEASKFVGVYKWGTGFKVYGPWKDSDRRGARTESECHYWNTAQHRLARRRAELALWVFCDESNKMPEQWKEWYVDSCNEMHRKQEYEGGLSARELLSIGIANIDYMCKKYPIPLGE